MIKYKKIQDNENAIEIDGKVVLPFDKRFKEYLKWRDKNPELEKQLVEELEQETENKRLYNNGAPHVKEDENGKREGRCIFYFENGNKKWEGNYKDGKLNGELISESVPASPLNRRLSKYFEAFLPYGIFTFHRFVLTLSISITPFLEI